KAARALVDHRDAAQAEELLGLCPAGMEDTWEHRHVLGLYQRLSPLTFKRHTGRVNGVAYSADGRRLASGSADRTVKLWNAKTGQEKLTLKGHTGRVTSVEFIPDGKRVASGSFDGTVRVWGVQTGQEKLTLNGHTDRVLSVAYSPDGRRIASGSDDNTVK